MSIEILMPALSPTMTDGVLNKWLIKIGDKVKAGTIIAEIETDKATMEIEAVDEGKLTNILVKEGSQNVAVNTVMYVNGETVDASLFVKAYVRSVCPPVAQIPAKIIINRSCILGVCQNHNIAIPE